MKQSNLSPLLIQEITEWRHHLHTHPETAFEEYNTSLFIQKKLKSFGIEVMVDMPETAVIGKLQRSDEPFIALRADMDGLFIEEKNTFLHKSKNEGKMHACGHDGHMAMLLGAAKHLAENKDFKGNVYFIFQPAEENEGGARAMIENGLFNKFDIKAIFGMHNWPELEEGKIGIKDGSIMASCNRFEILLSGKGTHAAMPHKGNDLILSSAELIIMLHSKSSRNNPFDSSILSITSIDSPDSWNILPESIKLKGTIRCFSKEKLREIQKQIKDACKSFEIKDNIKCELKLHSDGYPATVNSVKETEFIINTAKQTLGEKNVITNIQPSMGSEDFSFFLDKIPGCYFFLGAGINRAGLHNPSYDFNDKILPIGTQLWIDIAKNYFL